MIYIDMKKRKNHSIDDHMKIVHQLLDNGYTYVGNTSGNPRFYHPADRRKPDICILANVITQKGYFAI